MSEIVIRPVILCGGAGTRLWPMSRHDHPKQFLTLGGEKSLLAQAILRSQLVNGAIGPLLIAGEDHRFFARAALEESGSTGLIILEPVSRNTAAAIAVAATQIARIDGEETILAVTPSDHFIRDAPGFARAISRAARLVTGNDTIGLVGIKPEEAHTGYGYIAPGAEMKQGSFSVVAFHEKPDAETARSYVENGYYWNAGVFVASARAFIQAFSEQAPDILHDAGEALEKGREDDEIHHLDQSAYERCRSQSIDYAVMEAYRRCLVVPFAGVWSDLGSWNAIGALRQPDQYGNRHIGDVVVVDSRDTFIMSEHRLTVALGVENLTVIDTQDSILIASNAQVDRVRDVVAMLKSKKRPEVDTPVRVERPWGHYEVLSQGPGYQMKRIVVKPGGKLSLQYHHHRAEHWIVVAGEAEVTRNDEVFLLMENESTFIPLGSVHRLHNPKQETLVIIEVQTGSYLGEDDIVRVEDVYGREASSTKPLLG